MNELTPGPWTWDYSNDVGPDDDYFIEFFEIRNDKHELVGRADREADARLIAAAPAMIEILKASLQAMEHLHRTGDTQVFDLCYAPELIPAIKNVIEQATGES